MVYGRWAAGRKSLCDMFIMTSLRGSLDRLASYFFLSLYFFQGLYADINCPVVVLWFGKVFI